MYCTLLKKLFFVFFAIFCTFFSSKLTAQNTVILSDKATISLVTVAPGDNVNDTFGHTLLWISDSENNIDLAYNWGVYDFSTEGFYVKFVKGQLPYSLAAGPIYNYISYYQSANRNMQVQELDLPLSEKQKIFQLVENNYLPQNRLYFYKFYTDNCATRVLDIVQKACGSSFQLNNLCKTSDSTYRYWMNKDLKTHEWARLGMNMTLGMFADLKIPQSGACYIPYNLSQSFSFATFNGKKLVSKTPYSLFEVQNPAASPPIEWYLSPVFVLSILLLIGMVITLIEFKNKKEIRWFDNILFGFTGIIGWFLFALWFFTDHITAKNNLNLLWALPLHFPVIYFFKNIKPNKSKVIYFGVVSLLLIISISLVAKTNADLIPFVLLLLLRAIKIIFLNTKSNKLD